MPRRNRDILTQSRELPGAQLVDFAFIVLDLGPAGVTGGEGGGSGDEARLLGEGDLAEALRDWGKGVAEGAEEGGSG